MSKWREPTDEERLRSFLAKQQTVDVQPAYYRTGGVDTGEPARMETGAQYKGASGTVSGGSGSHGSAVAETQTCFSCRTQQAKNAKFCAGCGSKMGPPPSAAGVRCPGCGHQNTAGKFCSACGHNLSSEAAPPPTCGCGALKTSAKFCANCGEKWH